MIEHIDSPIRVATARADHYAAHRAVTADAEAFVAGTVDRYTWPAEATEPGMRLVGGRCPTCGSDLGIQVAEGHALVAEIEGAPEPESLRLNQEFVDEWNAAQLRSDDQ
jgi:hypothetical protein